MRLTDFLSAKSRRIKYAAFLLVLDDGTCVIRTGNGDIVEVEIKAVAMENEDE